MLKLIWRICFLVSFLYSAWRWGDWKNWQKYYPTVLFTMVINLAISFITYHHVLWKYNADALVTTQTVVEIINVFFLLPAATFIYLSRFPNSSSFMYQGSYIALWVVLFGSIEFIAHYIIGSISYDNGWAWPISVFFDVAMFSILRIHYLRPAFAWFITILLSIIILSVFNFSSAEIK